MMRRKKSIYILEIEDIEPLKGWVEITQVHSTDSYIIRFDEELEDKIIELLQSKGARFLTEVNE